MFEVPGQNENRMHVSVHEIETNEGDNLFTLRQEKIK